MSFSKAKLHRFNDDISCAPPPGKYDPMLISKVIGPLIHKTERFGRNKQIVHGKSTESLSSLINENRVITQGQNCQSQTSTETESVSTVSDASFE